MVHLAYDLNQLSQRDILEIISPVFLTDISDIVNLRL